MTKVFGTYAAVFVVMLALDALWLGFVARSFYAEGLGDLMAKPPRLGVAAVFYVMYAAGLTLFAVWPQAGTAGLSRTLLMGALLGLFAYGTYDLTNLATLRGWPVKLSLVDMAWGTVVSAVSAAAGKFALDRIGGG